MPLVLDDVLVNFDTPRAAAAAEVLQSFAADGHQLLVFTCHEHLARVFKSLGVKVRRLPSRDPHDEVELTIAEIDGAALPKPRPQPRRRKSRVPREPQPQLSVLVPADPIEVLIQPVPLAIDPPAPRTSPAVFDVRQRHPCIKPASVPEAVEMPVEVVELEPAMVEIIPLPAARRHRADFAHARPRRVYRHRWSAEEFDGELEDRLAVGESLRDSHADGNT
jgi:hypothetical protein